MQWRDEMAKYWIETQNRSVYLWVLLLGLIQWPGMIFAILKVWNFHFPSYQKFEPFGRKSFFHKSQLADWKFISEIFIAYSHISAYFPRILAPKLPELPNSNYA